VQSAEAYREGAGRVRRAPAVWLGAWAVTLLMALPPALVLRDMMAGHLDASLAAGPAAEGVNGDWMQEFREQASGIGRTLDYSVIGFAAVLRHLSDVADAARPAPALAVVVGAWLLVWSFLAGGILDRYARNRPTWASGFFAACGTHFFRFLRLGVLAALVHGVLFVWVHPWLFTTMLGRFTRDLDVERTAFLWTAAAYVVFGMLLAATSIVFEYARIRIVVEDRRSAIGALAAAIRFVRRRAGSVAGLYLLITATFLLAAALYALVAPGAWPGGVGLWLALAGGQAWIALRVAVKLLSYASGVCLFQRALAHAEYVAGAVPQWPESPAAEALRGDPPAAVAP
jgi:hypothetical protein